MKHAGEQALNELEPLLRQIRALPGLREHKRGTFYRAAGAFVHFHEDPAGLFADLKDPNGEFARFRVSTAAERTKLLAQVRKLLASPPPLRRR